MTDTQTNLFKSSVTDQLAASLKMLQACVDQCPDSVWENEVVGKRRFWEVAYHIAFYTDLYLTPHFDQYTGQPDWAWTDAAGLGHHMEPPFDPLTDEEFGPTLERQLVSQYLVDTTAKLHRVVPDETAQVLAGESGFFWYPINRLSMHMVNLRHVMHHTGQLSAALRKSGIAVDWVATVCAPNES